MNTSFFDFTVIQSLQGNVWKCLWKDTPVIVKIFEPRDVIDAETEAKVLRELEGPHRFPKVLDYRVLNPPQRYYNPFHRCDLNVGAILVLEFIEATPLYSDTKFYRGFKDVRKAISQLLDQVKYIHSKRIVHHDLADRNILITPEQDVIIIDFGISFSLEPPYRRGRVVLPDVNPLQLDGYHLLGVIRSLIKAGDMIDETLEARLNSISNPKTIDEIRQRLGLPLN